MVFMKNINLYIETFKEENMILVEVCLIKFTQ